MKKILMSALSVAALSVLMVSCNNQSPKMDEPSEVAETATSGISVGYIELDTLFFGILCFLRKDCRRKHCDEHCHCNKHTHHSFSALHKSSFGPADLPPSPILYKKRIKIYYFRMITPLSSQYNNLLLKNVYNQQRHTFIYIILQKRDAAACISLKY